MDVTTANGRPSAWLCALGIVIFLVGCQPQASKAPPLPPPLPPAAPLPQPVLPTFYVTVNQLNIRACPGIDCPKISTLELNAEVEKMGEIENWTQIRVKKNGTIGYVSSRYLSPHPVEVAKPTKKKTKKAKPTKKRPKKAKPAKATPPTEAHEKAGQSGPKKQESSPPLPHVM